MKMDDELRNKLIDDLLRLEMEMYPSFYTNKVNLKKLKSRVNGLTDVLLIEELMSVSYARGESDGYNSAEEYSD